MFLTLQDLAGMSNFYGLGQTVLPPSIASILPVTGGVGVTVSINGSNLTGATAVAFNGVPASFTVVSPNQINAIVPAGTTTGPVSVTTPGGAASFSLFTLYTAPAVPAGTLTQQAVDDVLRPLGLPSEVPNVYTLDRLYAIQNAAITRGVDPTQAVGLVRQEVFRRVLQSDPNPQGGLTELAQRLTGTTGYAPQAPALYPAPPAPPAYYQAPFQPSYQVQAPAPVEEPRRRAPKRAPVQIQRGGLPSWAPIAAAAVGGALLIAVLVKK